MHRTKLIALLVPLAAMLAVACGNSSPVTSAGRAGTGVGVQPAQAPTAGSGSTSASDAAAKPGSESAALPTATIPEGQRVQRNARIALQVPNGRFDQALDDVQAIAVGAGGYLSGTDAQSADVGQPLRSGQVTYQIPAKSFDDVIQAIRRKGTAQSIQISGNDVSQQYVDLQARLRNAEAQRDSFLALMTQAKSVSDIIQVQNQLGQITSQIEQLKGQIDYLDHSTTYATVAVTIREVAAGTAPRDQWGLQTAVNQAAHNFVSVIAFVVLALGTLAPLLIGGAVLVFVLRRMGLRWPRRTATAPISE